MKKSVVRGKNSDVKNGGPWWESVTMTDALRAEFLADYHKDFRLPNNTNRDIIEKWKKYGCTTMDRIRNAAYALGERRNRPQIIEAIREGSDVIHAIASRSVTLFRAGVLGRVGLEQFYAQIMMEFGTTLASEERELSLAAFEAVLSPIVWTEGKNGTLTALKDFVRVPGLDLAKFHQHHPRIPRMMIDAKAQELRGISNILHPIVRAIPFMRGMGQIRTGEVGDYKLPKTSFEKPLVIEVDDPENWNVRFLNGAMIGTKHGHIIEENPARRALASGKRDGAVCIFGTGLVDLDMTKAVGPSRALRALFSGRDINEKILDPDYQSEALKIIKKYEPKEVNANESGRDEVREQAFDDMVEQVLYETWEEALENLLSGWHKICVQPDGQPEFSGRFYLLLGIPEMKIITAATYWRVRYYTFVRQQVLDAEIRSVRSGLDSAGEDAEEEDIENSDEQDRVRLGSELRRLIKERARTIISNVSDMEWQWYFNQSLADVVRRFEEKIPNCTVIGRRSAHVKLGRHVIPLHIPSHTRITDTLLSEYTRSTGPKIRRGQFGSATVILHPYAPTFRGTTREADAEGKRGSGKIYVAPICQDDAFLREELGDMISGTHPIAKLIANERFAPGVMRLSCVNDVVIGESISIEALGTYKEASKANGQKIRSFKDEAYIWCLVGTDPHWGAQDKAFIWSEEFGVDLGMTEAVMHIFRREGYGPEKPPPIHFFVANDDLTQGHHFSSETQPHPHKLSIDVIEKQWANVFAEAHATKSVAKLRRIVADMRRFDLYQYRVRGEIWTNDQLAQFFSRSLRPNADMFSAILMRALNANIELHGVGEFYDIPFGKEIAAMGFSPDRRNPGFINLGNGNHMKETTFQEICEGDIASSQLRLLLAARDEWRGKETLLEKYVRSPLYPPEFISWGIMNVPGGHQWGIDFRNRPASGMDWNDPTLKMERQDLRRGNYARIHDGDITKVVLVGNNHFFGISVTSYAVYAMGPAGTETSVYGERGFAPNNTGVLFLGLPVNGPNAAPVLAHPLHFDQLKHILDTGKRFDVERFLPNAV